MLPVGQRLRANREFRTIYARGKSFAHPVAVLYVMLRTGDYARAASGRRIGFVVSKKQGAAVVRNRIKRRVREAVRRRLADLSDGPIDMIFVGRSRASAAEWSEIEEAVDDLLRRGRLLAGARGENPRGQPDGGSDEHNR